MKLVYYDAHLVGDEDALRAAFPDAEIELISAPLTSETLRSDATVISVFSTSKLNADLLMAMPELKLIATRSTGFDHIDLGQAEKQDIVVSTVPHYGERTVAEHTFALILALARKIFQAFERTEKMNFEREGLTGFDLQGKTLGVIGTGNIGKNVISIGNGFGMNVIAHDVHPNEGDAATLGFTYVETLEELLSQSDVITLHVPFLDSTRHMLNKETLALVKPGALLINTARGGLIETEALLWALNEGVVGGAGLDVLEEEDDAFDRVDFMAQEQPKYEELMTLMRNHLLVARDDVIITPHNAYNSREAVQRIFDTTVENIKNWEKGEPSNLVQS